MFRLLIVVLLRIGVPIAIGYILWRAWKRKPTFSIVLDETGVRSHQGITTNQQQRLLELLQKTRFVEGQVVVRGRSQRSGQLKLEVVGPLSDEAKQQVQDYIASKL